MTTTPPPRGPPTLLCPVQTLNPNPVSADHDHAAPPPFARRFHYQQTPPLSCASHCPFARRQRLFLVFPLPFCPAFPLPFCPAFPLPFCPAFPLPLNHCPLDSALVLRFHCPPFARRFHCQQTLPWTVPLPCPSRLMRCLCLAIPLPLDSALCPWTVPFALRFR